jgi:hypothetical protein
VGRQFDETPVFPIAAVVEHYAGDVTYRGGWSPMACPFHGNDRNPSASIHHGAQRFCCHTCMERSEDAIGLVMWQEGCEFKAAVEICESIATAVNEPAVKKPGGMSSMFD